MQLIPDAVTKRAAALGTTAQNVLEVARFGGLETGEEPAPVRVVGARARVPAAPLLRRPSRRRGAAAAARAAADAQRRGLGRLARPPARCAILHELGVDPWVVDFGAPEQEEGGLERTLADHVLAVSEAVDHVREATGRDVHLGGYSQGGMFCYQTAAYRRSEGVESLITFGSPVNLRDALPLGLPEDVAVRGGELPRRPGAAGPGRARLDDPGRLPDARPRRSRCAGSSSSCSSSHDREALLPREGQRKFLMDEGWVAWPGPALAEFMRQFVTHNRMLRGGFTIEDRLVTLADIDSPILCFVGEVDEIAPPSSVRADPPRPRRGRTSTRYRCRPGTSGSWSGARRRETRGRSWPAWARWLSDGEGALPEAATPVARRRAGARDRGPTDADRLRRRAGGQRGRRRVPRRWSSTVARSTRTVREPREGGHASSCRGWRGSPPAREDTRLSLALRARRAGQARARRRVLPVRGPRLRQRRGQAARRRRGARAAVDRRPQGRARRAC